MMKIKSKCLSKISLFTSTTRNPLENVRSMLMIRRIYIDHVITNVPSIQQYCMKNKRTHVCASQEPMGKTISIKTIKQYVNVSTFKT